MGARRPRLFSFSREIELSNLEGWATPEQLPLLHRVIDAFSSVARTRKLSEEHLAPIVEAISHDAPAVQALGAARLAVLTHYFEAARAAYLDAFTTGDTGLRIMLIGHVPNTAAGVAEPILAAALESEEPRTRAMAERIASR